MWRILSDFTYIIRAYNFLLFLLLLCKYVILLKNPLPAKDRFSLFPLPEALLSALSYLKVVPEGPIICKSALVKSWHSGTAHLCSRLFLAVAAMLLLLSSAFPPLFGGEKRDCFIYLLFADLLAGYACIFNDLWHGGLIGWDKVADIYDEKAWENFTFDDEEEINARLIRRGFRGRSCSSWENQ